MSSRKSLRDKKGCPVPKHIAEQELKQIEARSLLRRLGMLIENQRIRATGAFKGRVYWPIAPEAVEVRQREESLIPLSEAGSEVRGYVSQPIQRREPVGYRRDFLLSYPESGSYLDDLPSKRASDLLCPN